MKTTSFEMVFIIRDIMATDRPRYTVSVTTEMFEEIENFRFMNRYQTRSEATAELIRLGLEQLKKEQEEEKAESTSDDQSTRNGASE